MYKAAKEKSSFRIIIFIRSAEDTDSQHFAQFPHDNFPLGCEIRLGEKPVTSHLPARHQHWISQYCYWVSYRLQQPAVTARAQKWGNERTKRGEVPYSFFVHRLSPAHHSQGSRGCGTLVFIGTFTALAIAPKEDRGPPSCLKAEGRLRLRGTELGRAHRIIWSSQAIGLLWRSVSSTAVHLLGAWSTMAQLSIPGQEYAALWSAGQTAPAAGSWHIWNDAAGSAR